MDFIEYLNVYRILFRLHPLFITPSHYMLKFLSSIYIHMFIKYLAHATSSFYMDLIYILICLLSGNS